MNQYIVVKNQQIAIEAEDPDEAVKKALNGEGTSAGVSYNVQIRPQPPTQAIRAVAGIGGSGPLKP